MYNLSLKKLGEISNYSLTNYKDFQEGLKYADIKENTLFEDCVFEFLKIRRRARKLQHLYTQVEDILG